MIHCGPKVSKSLRTICLNLVAIFLFLFLFLFKFLFLFLLILIYYYYWQNTWNAILFSFHFLKVWHLISFFWFWSRRFVYKMKSSLKNIFSMTSRLYFQIFNNGMPILIWSTHPLTHTWTSRSKMVFYFDMTWTDVGDLMAITSLPSSSSSRFDSILASLDTSVQFLSVDVSILSCWLAWCMNGGGWIVLFGCCCCCRWIELVFKPCFKFVVAWSHNDALYQYNKQMEWSMRKKIDYTLLSVKFAIEKKQIFFLLFRCFCRTNHSFIRPGAIHDHHHHINYGCFSFCCFWFVYHRSHYIRYLIVFYTQVNRSNFVRVMFLFNPVSWPFYSHHSSTFFSPLNINNNNRKDFLLTSKLKTWF